MIAFANNLEVVIQAADKFMIQLGKKYILSSIFVPNEILNVLLGCFVPDKSCW